MIKSFDGAMAALSTNDRTFKIKKAENTNKLYILNGTKIETVTSVQIEFSLAKTKVYQVLSIL